MAETRCVSRRRLAFADTQLWASFLMNPESVASQTQRTGDHTALLTNVTILMAAFAAKCERMVVPAACLQFWCYFQVKTKEWSLHFALLHRSKLFITSIPSGVFLRDRCSASYGGSVQHPPLGMRLPGGTGSVQLWTADSNPCWKAKVQRWVQATSCHLQKWFSPLKLLALLLLLRPQVAGVS